VLVAAVGAGAVVVVVAAEVVVAEVVLAAGRVVPVAQGFPRRVIPPDCPRPNRAAQRSIRSMRRLASGTEKDSPATRTAMLPMDGSRQSSSSSK
jgi:hypothetical protein